MGVFRLQKYYMDVVSPDGACAVAYWGEVSFGPLRIPYSAILHLPARRAPSEAQAWRGKAPRFRGTSIEWHSRALGVEGRWGAHEPRSPRRLISTRFGGIQWQLLQPAGPARIAIKGRGIVDGFGYVERLDLDLAPWRFPFGALRWGRFIADDGSDSLVWIDWSEGMRRRWILHRGRRVRCSLLDESEVRTPRASLHIDRGRVLRDAPIVDSIHAPIPLSIIPGVRDLRNAHETKWLSKGTLLRDGVPPLSGWVLHEVVRWR